MSDVDRMRKEYQERDNNAGLRDLYSLSNPAYRFMKSQLSKKIANQICKSNSNFADLKLLEIGCGNGNVMYDISELGIRDLLGVDIIHKRVRQAHDKYPGFLFICADGQSLPFVTGSYDVVIQFTAFSSVLDPYLKKEISRDMLRVVRSTGLILWYDFWLNPINRQTRGIRPAEIRQLFPHCTYEFHKITLAPPIARRIVPISRTLSLFLENLKLFNSHYLVAIKPNPG
jgi:ubiquinone/menaquinone biosynthesis C-methylase UbiE